MSVCVSVWYAWVRVCPPRCRVCKAVYGAANPDKKQRLSILALLEMQLPTCRSSLGQVLPASPCSHTTGPREVLGLGEVTRTQDLAESDWTHCLDSQGHMLFGTYHWSKQSVYMKWHHMWECEFPFLHLGKLMGSQPGDTRSPASNSVSLEILLIIWVPAAHVPCLWLRTSWYNLCFYTWWKVLWVLSRFGLYTLRCGQGHGMFLFFFLIIYIYFFFIYFY